MEAYYNRFSIKMTLQEARDASHQGDCYQDCKELAATPKIGRQLDKISPDSIRAELQEYGAWDELELSDVAMNRVRIIWLAACDIREAHQFE